MQKSSMRRFANLYIFWYLVDAGFSLLDELLKSNASSVPLITELRNFVAYIVIALSMVIFACLGVDRRLPKRVVLPMTIYIFWCTLELWPLAGLIGRDSVGLVSAVGQLALGGLILLMCPGGGVLLPADLFRTPMFSWRNTLGFTLINLLLLPFILVFSVVAAASNYLEHQTAGFMRLGPVGIYMSERSYHHADKVVRLAAMMHIGKEEYYRDLADSMLTAKTIILAEGVTDRDHLLENKFNYSKLAGIIGLSTQQEMFVDANQVNLDELGEASSAAARTGKPDIARADLDLNRFNPQTIEFLNVLGRTLLSDKPLVEGFAEYNAWADANMTPERISGVMTDILDKRNTVVIEDMLRSLRFYNTVIIPWGAMHMPAIEAAVIEQGFTPGPAHERLSLDFRHIPYREIWQKWLTAAEGG
jgi:hypothetical protein